MVLLRRMQADDGGGYTAFDPALDAYGVLQLHPAASRDLIDRAYWLHARRLRAARAAGEPGARALLDALNSAYAILAEHDSRAAYDRLRGYGPLSTVVPSGGGRWPRRTSRIMRISSQDWRAVLHVAPHAASEIIEVAHEERRAAARSPDERRRIDQAHAAARQDDRFAIGELGVLPIPSPAVRSPVEPTDVEEPAAAGINDETDTPRATPAEVTKGSGAAAFDDVAQADGEPESSAAMTVAPILGSHPEPAARAPEPAATVAHPQPTGEIPAPTYAVHDAGASAASSEPETRPADRGGASGFGRAFMRLLGNSHSPPAERAGPATARIDRARQAVEAAQNRILALRDDSAVTPRAAEIEDPARPPSPASAPPVLVVTAGRSAGLRIPLESGAATVGVTDDAGVIAPADPASERFRVWQRGEHFLLRVADADSVRLNGRPLASVAILEEGDEIDLDGEQLRFEGARSG